MFPVEGDRIVCLNTGAEQVIGRSHGLTIRACFAAMAMRGIISQAMEPITDTEVAKRAVWCADALVTELNKVPRGQSYEEQQEGPQ